MLEYDGTDFAGFQRQGTRGRANDDGLHAARLSRSGDNRGGLCDGARRTVQASVESAIAAVTGEELRITAAGRTDAGVHAQGQVVHIRTASELSPEVLGRALNAHLPEDVSVRSVRMAPDGFHARHSARSRVYRYTLYDTPARAPLLRRQALHVPEGLDVERMAAAAGHLIGRHDFGAFAAEEETTSTTRVLHRLECAREASVVSVEVEGDAFLRHMVRRIVGTLIRVGMGRLDPDSVGVILENRDKGQAGPTAPPVGLCLMRVNY